MLMLAVVLLAGCDPDLVPGAVVARVEKADLEKVLAPVGGLVPQQMTLDGMAVTVSECGLWFDDTVVTVQRGDVRLADPRVELVLTTGGFDVRIRGNLDVSARLDVQLCALPDTTCDARMVANGAQVVAQAFVAVNACTPQVSLSQVVVEVEGDIGVDVSGCPVYDDIFTALYDWFEDDLVAYALNEVEAYIAELVASQIDAMSANIMSAGTEIDGVTFKAQPESIAIDGDGISVSFAAASEHYGLADCLEGVDWRREPMPPDTEWPRLTGTSVGISQRFVQDTLESAWRAGWLCLDLADIYPDAGSMLEGFGKNVQVHATAGTLQPPRITFTRSDAGSATIDIGHLTGHLTATADNKQPLSMDLLGGLTIGAETFVKSASNEIMIAPRSVELRPFAITMNGTEIPWTQDDADRYVREEVAPVLAQGVAELPIVSSLFTTALTPISITKLHSIERGLIADIHVGQVDITDTTPPTTSVPTPPVENPDDGSVDIAPEATDNATPIERMRWRVTVDGWRYPNLFFGKSIHLEDLSRARHRIRIHAVDAMGNEDPVGADIGPAEVEKAMGIIAGGGCFEMTTDVWVALAIVGAIALRRILVKQRQQQRTPKR